MLAFLKSDLFLRFLGGFVLGAVGVFALQPSAPPALTTPAMAASASATSASATSASATSASAASASTAPQAVENASF